MLSRHASLSCATVVALLFVFVSTSHAADRFWFDPNGGTYNSVSNWSTTSGGANGASVPIDGDIAVFDLNATYDVDFSLSFPATTTGLEIETGNVKFDLNDSTYTLTGGANNEIGRVAGQTGRLTLVEGVLAVESLGDNIEIGANTGSSGFMTVGSDAVVGSDALRPDWFIGDFGQGTLTVEDGGDVFASSFYAGYFGNGSATIRNPGSSLDIASSNANVGYNTSGSLSISDGATVSMASILYVGRLDEGNGSVSVFGDGAELNIGSTLLVGDLGNGSFSVSSGGRVSSSTVNIGDETSGAGVASISGSGSRWDSGSVIVGDAGEGELYVTSGGVLNSTSGTVGNSANAVGRVEVSGSGARWNMSSTLRVGFLGSGELLVENGGEVYSSSLTISNSAGSNGSVNITGNGSLLNTTNSIVVGASDDGQLTVSNGAIVAAGADFTNSSTGSTTLEGGSMYVANDFENEGTFTHIDGLLRVAGDFVPRATIGLHDINGASPSDLPAVELVGVDGATTNVSQFIVGNRYRGRLTIAQGRSVNLGLNGVTSIALDPGSEGTVDVESGAELVSDFLAVGGGANSSFEGGNGTLNIENGLVDALEVFLFDGGVINLDGGTLEVRDFTVFDGQVDWTAGEIRFSDNKNWDATLSSKLLGPTATLGTGKTLSTTAGQTLTVQTSLTLSGGVVAADNLTNDSTIRGSGTIASLVTNNVGGNVELTTGDLLALDGGANNSGDISAIGGELRADGAIQNNATGLISARNAILRFNGGVTNDGGIAFSNGTVDVYGDITQNAGARITVSGGGIANFYDDVILNAGAADVQASAFGSTVSAVVFFGEYSGGVTGGGDAFIEGDHRPGASPGLVSFGGNVGYGAFSTLEIELAGTDKGNEYDSVDVAGEAAIFGTLDVSLLDGFSPEIGDVFEIITAAGGISGQFQPGATPELDPLLSLRTIYSSNAVSLVVAPALDGDFNLDGIVDAADYTVWRDNEGATGLTPWSLADGNGDGDVTQADYDVWRSQFGSTLDDLGALASTDNLAVPEPSGFALFGISSLIVLCGIRRAGC